ncbi:TolC family protein [Lujinxingia vulgaris]|uniref:TolC family protein n=1 Tax=Lujinxingia vulgaris TaxID=2600176 RepID=UPI001E32BDA8|nr:TolC family protein [Lujinxingia vulgaris]
MVRSRTWRARARSCSAVSALLVVGAWTLPEAAAQQIEQRDGAESSAPETTTASATGLSLDEVLRELETQNESWTITELQIEQSRASRREALGSLLPQLSSSANVTYQGGGEVEVQGNTVREAVEWGVNANASMSLFNAPQYFTYRQADRQLDATQAQSAWQRTLLQLEAEESFYTLAAAQRDVDIAESAVDLRRAYLDRSEALVDAGLAVAVDVSRARQQVLEAEQTLLEARQNLGNAADALAYLLGREPDGELRVDFDPDVIEGGESSLQGATNSEVSREREDFVSRRYSIEAAELARRATWWGLVPSLQLTAGAQLGQPTLFNPNGFNWTVGIGASWLLYDGGARYARLDRASAQIAEQELALKRDLRQASTELRRASRDLDTARAAIDVAREQVQVAQETYEFTSARFESGLATSLEVSDASQQLLSAELRLNQARLQARLAEVRYRYLEDLPE